MKRKNITKEQLVELYLHQNLPASKCKKILGISNRILLDYLQEYDIKKTNEQKYNCRSQWTHKYNDEELKQKVKELYIDRQLSSVEVKKELKISAGKLFKLVKELDYKRPVEIKLANMEKTCLDKYGSSSSFGNGRVREKIKRTFLEKYGVDNYSKSEEYRLKSEEIHKQIHETRKKNGTLYKKLSRKEEKAYEFLLEYFSKEDITRQYRSSLYPFNCDFYIKSLDLYIECQFSQYHGDKQFHCPYNPDDPTHIEQKQNLELKEYENSSRQRSQYKGMLVVWTVTDPLKRETAKKNNLNWKEFFTLEELRQWLENVSN